jgi:hypothetical protein
MTTQASTISTGVFVSSTYFAKIVIRVRTAEIFIVKRDHRRDAVTIIKLRAKAYFQRGRPMILKVLSLAFKLLPSFLHHLVINCSTAELQLCIPYICDKLFSELNSTAL